MPGCFSIPNRLNSFSVVKIVLSAGALHGHFHRLL